MCEYAISARTVTKPLIMCRQNIAFFYIARLQSRLFKRTGRDRRKRRKPMPNTKARLLFKTARLHDRTKTRDDECVNYAHSIPHPATQSIKPSAARFHHLRLRFSAPLQPGHSRPSVRPTGVADRPSISIYCRRRRRSGPFALPS